VLGLRVSSYDMVLHVRLSFRTDKQQELDLPSLRVEDSETVRTTGRKPKDASSGKGSSAGGSGGAAAATASASSSTTVTSSSTLVGRTMSHISGVKRPLSHSNSITSDKVAKYGVETPREHELGKVSLDTQHQPVASLQFGS
jgi:cAMP-specific phosphodiesterase 4